MKKPILLFTLKCTAIIYFVAFADVTGFTTVDTISTEGSAMRNTKKIEVNRTDAAKESQYLTKL